MCTGIYTIQSAGLCSMYLDCVRAKRISCCVMRVIILCAAHINFCAAFNTRPEERRERDSLFLLSPRFQEFRVLLSGMVSCCVVPADAGGIDSMRPQGHGAPSRRTTLCDKAPSNAPPFHGAFFAVRMDAERKIISPFEKQKIQPSKFTSLRAYVEFKAGCLSAEWRGKILFFDHTQIQEIIVFKIYVFC